MAGHVCSMNAAADIVEARIGYAARFTLVSNKFITWLTSENVTHKICLSSIELMLHIYSKAFGDQFLIANDDGLKVK